jgi:ribosomal protein L7/L12
MDKIAIIGKPKESGEMPDINMHAVMVSDRVNTMLTQLQAKLTLELGFDITPDQTVAWMLKQQGMSAMAQCAVRTPKGLLQMGPDSTSTMVLADVLECERLAMSGQKIMAIKHVREKTQWGLKDAKEFVERWWN